MMLLTYGQLNRRTKEKPRVVFSGSTERDFNADDREDHGDNREGEKAAESELLTEVDPGVPEKVDWYGGNFIADQL